MSHHILIFHAGGLGDFVLTWPLALALQRWQPGAQVVYVTQHSKGLLAQEYLRTTCRDLDGGRWHLLYGDPAHLPPANRHLLESSRMIVTFLARQSDAWMSHAQAAAPHTTFLPLSSIPASGYPGHATAFQQEQLKGDLARHLATVLQELQTRGLNRWRGSASNNASGSGRESGGQGESGEASGNASGSGRESRSQSAGAGENVSARGSGPEASPGSGRILLHPGSGSPAKNWPLPRYLELCRQLQRTHSVAILMGEVELDRWPAESRAQIADTAPLLTPASPLELAQDLQDCALFIGNDSGPGHLAAILGVPVLSLFGLTSPQTWRPLGPRVQVLQSPSAEISALSLETVRATAEATLSAPTTPK